jgi:CBS-domain-containing membrane protein
LELDERGAPGARASDIAVDIPTVPQTASIRTALPRLTTSATAHLLVIDEPTGHRMDVLSSSDILAAYAAVARPGAAG